MTSSSQIAPSTVLSGERYPHPFDVPYDYDDYSYRRHSPDDEFSGLDLLIIAAFLTSPVWLPLLLAWPLSYLHPLTHFYQLIGLGFVGTVAGIGEYIFLFLVLFLAGACAIVHWFFRD